MATLTLPPPRVLVIAKDLPRAAVWTQALVEIGCCARTADEKSAGALAYTSDVALLLPDALHEGLISTLRKAGTGRAFPILAAAEKHPLLDSVDDRLPERLMPTVAAPRIRSAFRAALAEEEMSARKELLSLSANDWLDDHPAWRLESAYRILFVGRPSPSFLALEQALQEAGMHSTASPITTSALEYAQDNDIDVVVADAIGSSQEALRFCLAMRSNAGLHHVPGILLAPKSFDQSAYALTRGVSEIISPDDIMADTTNRIARLAKQKRRLDAMKRFFSDPPPATWVDKETGLFTKDILARRLQSHISASEASARALSLGIIKLTTNEASKLDLNVVTKNIGRLLRRLVRLEDMAAAFDWRTYAVLMPGSNQSGAQAALARVCAIIDASVLQDARGQFPTIELRTNAAEFKSGESPGAFLIRASIEGGV